MSLTKDSDYSRKYIGALGSRKTQKNPIFKLLPKEKLENSRITRLSEITRDFSKNS
jgi:xanthine/CO dehydrogenase XdhC/CoxF family maturation factor